MAGLIVLDASVLIAHLDDRDAHHEAAELLLAATTDDRLAVSTITLAEVLVGPARSGDPARARDDLQILGIDERHLPLDASTRLATLRAETGLKMPDCCVLLAAETAGRDAADVDPTPTVATFDDRLATAASAQGFTVLPDASP